MCRLFINSNLGKLKKTGISASKVSLRLLADAKFKLLMLTNTHWFLFFMTSFLG